MSVYYCPSRSGFIDSKVITMIPDDAVPMTDNDYQQCLVEASQGKIPALVDGLVVMQEQVHRVDWEYIRGQRKPLLVASDWTQLPDVPLTPEVRAAWATYRQELRDIPQTQSDPTTIVWPDQPE